MPKDETNLIQRIKAIYHSVSPEDQIYLKQILTELANYGTSKTYNDLWLADYKEIPVDKTTFLTSSEYLGSTNNNGKSIYPAWWDVLKELEATGNQYHEIVLTGATRTGKTSTAVSDAAYQLYKVMCLRDPQAYFGLKSTTTIAFFFFNITQTLAKGVAFKEFNTTISSSPWFMKHGHMTDSETNPVYIPEGGQIEIMYGSDSSHGLGRAAYCLVGDTKVLTDDGIFSIGELADKRVNVVQLNPYSKEKLITAADIKLTRHTLQTVKVTLEDGSVIEGTPDHKVMLTDGTYKALGNLTDEDDIQEL